MKSTMTTQCEPSTKQPPTFPFLARYIQNPEVVVLFLNMVYGVCVYNNEKSCIGNYWGYNFNNFFWEPLEIGKKITLEND
jgi:hypothetical protein